MLFVAAEINPLGEPLEKQGGQREEHVYEPEQYRELAYLHVVFQQALLPESGRGYCRGKEKEDHQSPCHLEPLVTKKRHIITHFHNDLLSGIYKHDFI